MAGHKCKDDKTTECEGIQYNTIAQDNVYTTRHKDTEWIVFMKANQGGIATPDTSSSVVDPAASGYQYMKHSIFAKFASSSLKVRVRAWNINTPAWYMECTLDSAGTNHKDWAATTDCIQRVVLRSTGEVVSIPLPNPERGNLGRGFVNTGSSISPKGCVYAHSNGDSFSMFTKADVDISYHSAKYGWTYQVSEAECLQVANGVGASRCSDTTYADGYDTHWTNDPTKALIYAMQPQTVPVAIGPITLEPFIGYTLFVCCLCYCAFLCFKHCRKIAKQKQSQKTGGDVGNSHTTSTSFKPLPEGCKYHFFICKHEKYGASGAMNVYYELERRGYKVWISNGVEGPNLTTMQEAVRLSVCVLVFLTHGIFTRPWCMHLELFEAMLLKKPVCLVASTKGDYKYQLNAKEFSSATPKEWFGLDSTVHPRVEPVVQRLFAALEVVNWSLVSSWCGNRFGKSHLSKLCNRFSNRVSNTDFIYFVHIFFFFHWFPFATTTQCQRMRRCVQRSSIDWKEITREGTNSHVNCILEYPMNSLTRGEGTPCCTGMKYSISLSFEITFKK